MNEINLKIITIDGIFFSGSVTEIILPTPDGQIAVLGNHIPMVATLVDGIAVLKLSEKNNPEKKIHIVSGVLEVRPHSEVYILTDSATDI